jgi:hypothetical protein
MQKVREFIYSFSLVLACEVILLDIGLDFSHDKFIWEKYLTAAVFAALNTFPFSKNERKQGQLSKEK